MRHARPRSSRVSPAASPGARSGITTPSGRSGSTSSPPARCCRCRCRRSTSNEAALEKLRGFRLDGIVQKMTCPFLLLHGGGDEQIPLSLAEKCFAAVGSKQKTLKVFQREEGGFHHCQVDNVTIGVHTMWDWIADVLRPGT